MQFLVSLTSQISATKILSLGKNLITYHPLLQLPHFSENKNSSIRINIYPTQTYEKMVTVNCAKVTKPDNFATNGIVNLIEKVAAPATQSVQDIIKEHKKLTSLRQIFESTDSYKNLREEGHYTIFAPTDEAFEKLDGPTKQKLLRGDACALSKF